MSRHGGVVAIGVAAAVEHGHLGAWLRGGRRDDIRPPRGQSRENHQGRNEKAEPASLHS